MATTRTAYEDNSIIVEQSHDNQDNAYLDIGFDDFVEFKEITIKRSTLVQILKDYPLPSDTNGVSICPR